MNKFIFIAIFTALILTYLNSADATSDTEKKTLLEKYKEILTYGIEDEVVNILKDLGTTPKDDFYPLLKERYKESTQITTKTEFIKYFSNCDTLPEDITAVLYEDAISEPSNKKIHSTLLEFIGKKGNNEQRMLLVERLDYNDKLQSSAADALSKIESPELVKTILDRLKLSDTDDDKFLSDDIKGKLILSFGRMKAKEATEYLRNIVQETTSGKYLIMYAMVSLAQIEDQESIEIINKNLENEDIKIQEYAAYSLSLFKSEKVIPIYGKMFRSNNEKIRVFACQGVSLNNDTTSIDILIYKFQNDPSVNVKKEALQSLIYMGNAGINALKNFMKDKDYTEFNLFAISDAVRNKPDTNNVNFLLSLYQNANDKKKEVIAKNIIHSTSNLVDPIIKKLLESENYTLRINAIKTIYQIKDSTLWNEVKNISENDKSDIVKKTAKKNEI